LLLDIAISVYESMYVSRGALIISSISVFYLCGRSLTVAFFVCRVWYLVSACSNYGVIRSLRIDL